MFRFWYRFIPDSMSLIARGEADLAYMRIEAQIPAFMGAVFEDMCLQYLWQQNIENKTPITFVDAGRWWGNDAKRREECEIDIIADNGEDAIFAECKWTNKSVEARVLKTLIERSEMFRYRRVYYYLFSKTGFTADTVAEAGRLGGVTLVEFENFQNR
jgi:hypothetical protein